MRLGIFAFHNLPEEEKQNIRVKFVELYNILIQEMSLSPTRKRIKIILNISDDVISYFLHQIKSKRDQKYKGLLTRRTYELLTPEEMFDLKMKVRKDVIHKMALDDKSITEAEAEVAKERKMSLVLVQELSLTQRKIKQYVQGVLNGNTH